MSDDVIAQLAVFVTALFAAVVNGALGYGFSSITVPVALGFHSNRVVNPALVLLEFALNSATVVLHRHAVKSVWRKTLPLLAGLIPGVIAGAIFLGVAAVLPLKAATYAVLLPLILMQAMQLRWTVRRENAVGIPFGLGLGLLYSTTTISGPPLALYFNNQGLAQDEFRAAVGLLRLAESTFTLIVFLALGYFSSSSLELASLLAPAVLMGIPLGRMLIKRLPRETFRRVCMGVDSVLVSVGLGTALTQLGWVPPASVAVVLAAAAGFAAGAWWTQARTAPRATS